MPDGTVEGGFGEGEKGSNEREGSEGERRGTG